MGIMDKLFGAAPQQQTPQQQQPQQPPQQFNPQGQQVSPQSISSPSNPNVPSGLPAPATSTGNVQQVSPLDNYAELWQPVKQVEGAAPPASIVPQLDSTKLRASIKDANFIQSIDPTMMQNAMKGDVAAFSHVLNEAVKLGFEQSVLAGRTLTETSINNFGSNQRSEIPGMVKSQMVRETLQENPLYQHEATRPLISALEQQLSQKYPTATAAEITSHAQNYIKEFAAIAAPKQESNLPRLSKKEDFSNFF